MTLVLSLITHDCVTQVSDRRLVNAATGGLITDDRNKAVLYCGRIVFAFTGLARFGSANERTDDWLANSLLPVGGSQDEALQKLVDDATQAMAQAPVADAYKRHAFVGVGWAKLQGTDLRPYRTHVSNFLDAEGSPLAHIDDKFRGHASFLPDDERFRLFIAGQNLSGEDRRQLARNIRRGVDRGISPNETARLLVEQARRTAQTNLSVGRGLLLTAIPKRAIIAEEERGTGERFILASAPGGETSTFLYLPPGDDEGVQYGPVYVCEGRMMKNFVARSL